MALADPVPSPVRPLGGWWVAAGILLCLNLLWWLASVVPLALSYPYGLDFGEGMLWNQVRRILAGEVIYGPITDPPWIVANYPPGFYYLTAALQRLAPAADPLFLGRLLAIAGSLCILTLLAMLVRRTPAASRPVWLWLIPLLWLCAAPAWRWGVVMRVDTVAIALTLSGLLFVTGARPRLWPAAICFALAVLTKHSLWAAPLACLFAPAISGNRQECLRRWPLLALPLSGLLLGNLVTGGGLFQHIVGYTANEFRPLRLWLGVQEYVALSLPLWGCWLLAGPRRWWDPAVRVWTLYLALATSTLLTFGATGSDSNYYLEPLAALLAALIASWSTRTQLPEPATPPTSCAGFPATAVAGLLLVTFALTARWGQAGEFPLIRDPIGEKQRGDALVAWLTEQPGPVLAEEFSFALRAGKPPDFQPHIFRLLAETGKWDQAPFLERLDRADYAALLLRTDLFQPGNAEEAGRDQLGAGFDRLTPEMEARIRARYRLAPAGPVNSGGEWYRYLPRPAGEGTGP